MRWAFAILAIGLHAGTADAAGLNDRARMEEGRVGLPLDSLFKQGASRNVGSNEANPLQSVPLDSAATVSKRPAQPESAPLGSALGGRRKQP